ncbi:MAG: hypothetical protein EBR24_02960 [Flavobacteriia bacterium]|jgi:hypothetical protein|nr:hypothetical protein [Flavobacteriia bacterium]
MTSKTKKNENPSPLAKRICECGCEKEFQPGRSDQYHLNSIHYDFAYNHGPRKEKYLEENDATKAIRKNDRILEKYFKYCKKIRGDLNFIVLKADGFNEEIFTRILTSIEDEIEIKYFALYKYCYRIINQANNKYIRIHKI